MNWNQVFVYDDNFLRRAGGSRSSAPGSSSSPRHQKDAALLHYLKHFNPQKVHFTLIPNQYDTFNEILEDLNYDGLKIEWQTIIYHKEYSEDNAKFPLFAFKILSRFFGGKHIALNTEKVILVEKQFALRVFGQGPGCQALRCGYYLAYSAAAIAAGIKEPATLMDYGKRALIRSKKGRSIQGAIVPGIELSIEEVTAPRIELPAEEEDEEAEGRPQK